MRYSAPARVVTVLLAAIAIGAAGCGSSKNKTTSTAAKTPSATTKKSNSTKTTYRAGEFCSLKKSSVYRAQHLKCVKVKGTYRLEKS